MSALAQDNTFHCFGGAVARSVLARNTYPRARNAGKHPGGRVSDSPFIEGVLLTAFKYATDQQTKEQEGLKENVNPALVDELAQKEESTMHLPWRPEHRKILHPETQVFSVRVTHHFHAINKNDHERSL